MPDASVKRDRLSAFCQMGSVNIAMPFHEGGSRVTIGDLHRCQHSGRRDGGVSRLTMTVESTIGRNEKTTEKNWSGDED